MEDEVKMTEITVEEPVGEPTARQELETLLNEILPEEKRTGDVYQMALDYIREQIAMNDRMVEAISDDPRLAQVFAEVINGGKGSASLVRYFGKDFLMADEDSPEYEEMMAADKAFLEERDNAKKAKEEFDGKAVAWFEALEEYLEKKGLDKEKYLAEIEDLVIVPSVDLVIDEKLFDRLVKAVDYDKDVADSFKAGEVKGRNMNINEMKGKIGDGLPKAFSSQGVPVEQPKRRMNSLLEKALRA